MAALGLIDLKKEERSGQVHLFLTSDNKVIGEARMRFWGKKSEVGILVSLTLSPEAKKERSSHFEEWMIEQAKSEAISRHCSRLIVYNSCPTSEERKLYECLGFRKSIYGFCQSFSYRY